jgi:hypothetical protein
MRDADQMAGQDRIDLLRQFIDGRPLGAIADEFNIEVRTVRRVIDHHCGGMAGHSTNTLRARLTEAVKQLEEVEAAKHVRAGRPDPIEVRDRVVAALPQPPLVDSVTELTVAPQGVNPFTPPHTEEEIAANLAEAEAAAEAARAASRARIKALQDGGMGL